MRFLVDASSDARLAAYLRGLGHDVTSAGADYPASLKDITILSLALQEQRPLITEQTTEISASLFFACDNRTQE